MSEKLSNGEIKKVVFDSHMHTPLSHHTKGWPDDFAKEAINRNLKGIIFTDHAPLPRDYPYPIRWNMDGRDIANYQSLIEKARDAFKEDLHIGIGLEVDYLPSYPEYVKKMLDSYDYDYIIGSVHPINKYLFEEFYSGLSSVEGYKKYYQDLKNTASSGLFDCISHPDMVKECYDKSSWKPEEIKKEICNFLDEVKKQDIAIEFNTSGLMWTSDFYPCDYILDLIKDRDLPVVLGSDSHNPFRVAEHFKNALTTLKNFGYEKAYYYLKRKRYSYNIDEAISSLK